MTMRTRSIAHRSALAGVALVAALGLGACGGTVDGTGGPANSQAQQAEKGQEQVQDAKVGDEINVGDLAATTSAAMKKAGTAKMTMSGSEGMSGDVKYKDDGGIDFRLKNGTEEMLFIDGVMYISGSSISEATGGKKWAKLDPNGSDPMSKSLAGLTGIFEMAANPTSIYEGVDAKAKVTKVEGDKVTYEATFTSEQLQEMSKKMLGDSAGEMGSAAPTLESQSMTQIVDKEGRLLEVKLDENSTITYSDFGTDVSIEAPPEGEVGTFQMPSMPVMPTATP